MGTDKETEKIYTDNESDFDASSCKVQSNQVDPEILKRLKPGGLYIIEDIPKYGKSGEHK